MSAWILIPLLGLAALIQVTWLPLIPIFGFRPDLALIIVVSWSLLSPIGEAAQWGFVLGVFLDLTSGLPFGTHALSLTIIGLAMALAQRTFFRGNLLTPPISMMLATLLNHLIILTVLSLLKTQVNWSDYLVSLTLPVAILNTVIAFPIYLLLQFLQRRLYPRVEFQ